LDIPAEHDRAFDHLLDLLDPVPAERLVDADARAVLNRSPNSLPESFDLLRASIRTNETRILRKYPGAALPSLVADPYVRPSSWI